MGVVLYQEGTAAREFRSLNIPTQQVVKAILELEEPQDQHLAHFAHNLRVSEAIRSSAETLYNSEQLLGTWQEWLELVAHECLKPFHAESFDHCQRVPEVLRVIRQILARYGPKGVPDCGIEEFGQIRERLILSEEDWQKVEYAAKYHDQGKLAYSKGFWSYPGKFKDWQIEMKKAHPRMFYILGELFGVPLWVTGLAVFHHFLNLGYPENGLVAAFSDYLQDPLFLLEEMLLINCDCYDGIRGPRQYHRSIFDHFQTIAKLRYELRKIGPAMLPLLEAAYQTGHLNYLYAN
jgi:hypothetical protein